MNGKCTRGGRREILIISVFVSEKSSKDKINILGKIKLVSQSALN